MGVSGKGESQDGGAGNPESDSGEWYPALLLGIWGKGALQCLYPLPGVGKKTC